MNAIPHLVGYPDGKLVHIWCPFCCIWHQHGRELKAVWPGRVDDKPRHKLAHCVPASSPYNKTGYYIHETGDWTWKQAEMASRGLGLSQRSQYVIEDGRTTKWIETVRSREMPFPVFAEGSLHTK